MVTGLAGVQLPSLYRRGRGSRAADRAAAACFRHRSLFSRLRKPTARQDVQGISSAAPHVPGEVRAASPRRGARDLPCCRALLGEAGGREDFPARPRDGHLLWGLASPRSELGGKGGLLVVAQQDAASGWDPQRGRVLIQSQTLPSSVGTSLLEESGLTQTHPSTAAAPVCRPRAGVHCPQQNLLGR